MPTPLFDSLTLLVLSVSLDFYPIYYGILKKVQKFTQLTVKLPHFVKLCSKKLHAYAYFIAYIYQFRGNFTWLCLFKSLCLLDTLE